MIPPSGAFSGIAAERGHPLAIRFTVETVQGYVPRTLEESPVDLDVTGNQQTRASKGPATVEAAVPLISVIGIGVCEPFGERCFCYAVSKSAAAR